MYPGLVLNCLCLWIVGMHHYVGFSVSISQSQGQVLLPDSGGLNWGLWSVFIRNFCLVFCLEMKEGLWDGI